MKKLTAMILVLCMMCSAVSALADVAYGVLHQKIATRSGPGTSYFEPGTFLQRGDVVTVRTKVWDARNEIWWVQVEFYAEGDMWRAYTGSWRMNVDLSRVPQERSLGLVTVTTDADVFAGPGLEYAMWNDTVYRGTVATLLEVDNGYGHIECWNRNWNQTWRVWIRLNETNYTGSRADTYPAYGGTIQGSWNSGSNYGSNSSLVGQMCCITANSGNIRSGPGTAYKVISTVAYGQLYPILDTAQASNGVTWYKIDLGAQYGWISSGLTNFGKH